LNYICHIWLTHGKRIHVSNKIFKIIAVFGGHNYLFVDKSCGNFYKFISELHHMIQLRCTTFIHFILSFYIKSASG